MTQALLDDLDGDADLRHVGCMAVAQVVEADARHARLLHDAAKVPPGDIVSSPVGSSARS